MCIMQVYREYTLSIAYDLASSRHTSVRFFLFGARFTVGHGRPICTCKKVKVKASHTRYRALGPELIPVYRQLARR